MKHCSDIPIIIIANKADLVDETKLDNSLIQEFVNENKLLGFFITSVKNGKGLVRLLTRLSKQCIINFNFFNIFFLLS